MKDRASNHIILLKIFVKEMKALIESPVFILLTIFGNLYICLISYVFYLVESPLNPKIQIYLDALWWGFSTATTTGYGDITPITTPGKFLGILLMLSGLALFGMFTALFAETILTSAKRKN